MPDALVSVVIPCYNAERWIESTLESVSKQTWKNIQIIVVNDGSTDASESRVRAFPHPNLRLINQPKRGSSAAMNRGFAGAEGDFIQFLDADDVLHPDKIERQMARLMDEPACVATGEWTRFFGTIENARFDSDEHWREMDPVDWLVRAWRDGGGMLFPAQWLVPRGVALQAGPWREDLTLNNDGEYFTRVVLASKRVLFCDGARAYYRSGNPGSLSGLKSEAGWMSQRTSLEACVSLLLLREDSERTRRVASLLWQRFAHASYPYHRAIANDALSRARRLHAVRLEPEGGPLLRLTIRVFGWKAARVLQRSYYRFRYRSA